MWRVTISSKCLPSQYEALFNAAQAAVSRLNTMAAIIGVQDSLQHVGPQLWFLQSLLGKLTLIVHSLASRSLRLCSKQGPACMPRYLAAQPRYCSTGFIQPGEHGLAGHLGQVPSAATA